MIYEQKNTLSGYLFDGTMLFLSMKLANDVTQFMSTDKKVGHFTRSNFAMISSKQCDILDAVRKNEIISPLSATKRFLRKVSNSAFLSENLCSLRLVCIFSESP